MFERVKKGFTLVELLVVMAILAILTTVSTVGYFSFIEKAKISNDNTFASELNTLIQTMKVEDEEITYEDLCKMYLEQTGEDISTLKPQSAEYGYHFWFDQNNEEVIVARSEDLINESTIIFYNQSNSNLRELIIDNYIFLDGQGSDLADVISTYDSVNGKEAYLSLQTLLLDGADDKFDATLINKIDGIIDQTAFVTNEGSFRASILDETIYVKVAKNLESTCPSLFVYNGESLVESFIESSNPIACFDGVITLPETIKEIGTNSLFFESESLKIVLPNDLDTSNTLFSHFTNVNVVINDVEYVYVEESNSYESIENSEIVLETGESNLEITNFDVYFNDELVGNNYFSSLDINKEYLVSIKNVIGIPGGNIDQSNLVVEVISGEEICYSDNNVIVFEKYGTSIIKVYTNYNPDVYKEITIQMNGVTYFTSKINSSLLDGNSEETPFVIEKKEGVESFELSLETNWFVNKIEDVNLLDVSIESSLTYVANSNISYNFNMPEVGNYQITIKLNNHGLEKTIYISVIPEIEHYFDFNLENRDKYMYRFGNKNVFVPSEFVIATDELINANLELSDLVFEYNFYSVDEGDSKINLLDASGEKFYVTYSDTSRTSYKFIGEGVVEIEYISYLDGVEVDRNSIYLEVVNAKNVYSFADFTTNTNLVLMNDITWSNVNNDTRTFTNNFIYGNGYKIDATQIGKMSSTGGLINLIGSTIDNLIFIGKNYPEIVFNGAEDYYTSLVSISPSDEISSVTNSYLSGMRNPILVSSDVVIKNTTVYGGVYSNINIKSGNITVELDNITTIQELLSVKNSAGENKNVIGAGIYLEDSAAANEKTILVIKNNFNQFNFATKEILDKVDAADSYMDKINTAWKLNKEQLKTISHNIDGNDYLCTGIAYLGTKSFILDDSLMNKTNLQLINVPLSGFGFEGGVISYKHTDNMCDTYIKDNLLSFKGDIYQNSKYELIGPSIHYSFEEYDNSENGFVIFDDEQNLLSIGLPASQSKYINFNEVITLSKYGRNLTISALNLYANNELVASNISSYTFSGLNKYKLEVVVMDNYNYDPNGNQIGVFEYRFYLDINVSITSYLKPVLISGPSDINANKYEETGWLLWKDYIPMAAVVKGLAINDNGTLISFEDCTSNEELENRGLTIIPTNTPNGKPLNSWSYENNILYLVASDKWDTKMNANQNFQYTYISPISGLELTFNVTFTFYK